MVTIVMAAASRGYWHLDHQLDDRPAKDMIGRRYRSLGEARRAVQRALDRVNPEWPGPAYVVVRLESGDEVQS